MLCGIGGTKTTQRKLVLLYVHLMTLVAVKECDMACRISRAETGECHANSIVQGRWCLWEDEFAERVHERVR
jgi:hypothetical protein